MASYIIKKYFALQFQKLNDVGNRLSSQHGGLTNPSSSRWKLFFFFSKAKIIDGNLWMKTEKKKQFSQKIRPISKKIHEQKSFTIQFYI